MGPHSHMDGSGERDIKALLPELRDQMAAGADLPVDASTAPCLPRLGSSCKLPAGHSDPGMAQAVPPRGLSTKAREENGLWWGPRG